MFRHPKISQLIIFSFFISLIVSTLYSIFTLPRFMVASSDFVSFPTGALLIKAGKGELIYDLQTQFFYQQYLTDYARDWLLPFRSPPVVALAFIPLTYFPLILAYKLFAAFNLFILFLFTFFSGRIFPKIKKFKFWPFLPFIYLPSLKTIMLGQLSIILSLVLLFIYKSAKSKKSLLVGLLAGLIFLKPQYLIAIPFFFLLVPDRRRFILGFLLSFSSLALLSISVSGVNSLLAYLPFAIQTEITTFGSRAYHMYTFYSLLRFLPFSLSSFSRFLINGVFYLLALLLFAKRKRKLGPDKSFILAILFSILFSVHCLDHDLSFLLIPIFILLNQYKKGLWDLIAILILFALPCLSLIGNTTAGPFVLLAIVFYFLKEEAIKKKANLGNQKGRVSLPVLENY